MDLNTIIVAERPTSWEAVALGNAIRDAAGIRLQGTLFAADRLYRAVIDRHAAAFGPKGRSVPAMQTKAAETAPA